VSGARRSSCFKTTEVTVEYEDQLLWRQKEDDERDRLIEKLLQEGDEKHARILEKCGEEFRMKCVDCNARRVVFAACKKRWCPRCAPSLAHERVLKHQRAVLAMKWPLHVTLTRANVADLTRETLVQLLKAFRKLRQRRLWKLTVRGGFVSLELTNRGEGWHPHLHIVCDCEWLSLRVCPPRRADTQEAKAQKFKSASCELEQCWAEILEQKTASICVRRVHGAAGEKNAAVETMKYAVKPGALLESEGRASDVIRAMERTRLFRGFGSCAKLKLDTPREPSVCECGACNSFVPEESQARGKTFTRRDGTKVRIVR